MSNALIRLGSSYTIPATPYQPAQPAYTSYETFTGYRTGPPVKVGAWITIRIPRAGGGGSQDYDEVTIWDPSYSTGSTVAYTYSVLTYHPAVPEVQASPSQRVDVPPQGWNSYGHSAQSIQTTGEVKFKVPSTITGAAVGLSAMTKPTSGYGHILHGLIFTGAKVYSARTGVYLSTFASTDEFTVRNSGGIITFLKDGVSIGTEASTYAPGKLYLSTALYGARDSIVDPSIVQIDSGSAAMTMPAWKAFGWEGTKADAQLIMPAWTLNAFEQANSAHLVMPKWQLFASDRLYAEAAMTMPSWTIAAYGGGVAIELRNTADMAMPRWSMAAHAFAGTIASADMVMPAWRMFAADRPYAEAKLVMPAWTMSSYVLPGETRFLLESFLFDVQMTVALDRTAVMPIDIALDVGMTATVAKLPELMPIEMDFDVAFNVVSDFTGEMAILMMFDVPLTIPGTGIDVWCTNLANSGSTSYANYDFNSLARIGTRYYGAGAGGIVELDGDTDAGAPILATISPGTNDFGSPQKKTLVECFLAMKGTGPLLMRLLAEDSDYTYVASGYSPHMKQQRVKFGKGLRTNFVTPVIYNDDEGSDFELDAILFGLSDSQRKL